MKITFIYFSLLSTSLHACLHFDKHYSGEIKEETKMAFLFQEGGNAHLILKTELRAIKGTLPNEIAWVMPFPALPSKYEEVEIGVFEELAKLTEPQSKGGWGSRSKGAEKGVLGVQSLKVHEMKVVGNYQIQPIEILSGSASKDFDQWLVKNNFNPMPHELQTNYLKKGAVFLAIRMKLDNTEAKLKPLHVIYPATTLSFPLKFTHDTRTFNFTLYTATPQSLDAKVLEPFYLKKTGEGTYDSGSSRQLSFLLGNKKWVVTRFAARDLNTPKFPLNKLSSDPVLPSLQ